MERKERADEGSSIGVTSFLDEVTGAKREIDRCLWAECGEGEGEGEGE